MQSPDIRMFFMKKILVLLGILYITGLIHGAAQKEPIIQCVIAKNASGQSVYTYINGDMRVTCQQIGYVGWVCKAGTKWPMSQEDAHSEYNHLSKLYAQQKAEQDKQAASKLKK
jgi:hypothetical protein